MPSWIWTPSYFNGASTTFTASATALFLGGGSTDLGIGVLESGSTMTVGYVAGASPLAASATLTSSSVERLTPVLSAASGVTEYAITTSITNYPVPGDGFGPLRGVAPGCKWFGGKVFLDAGGGTGVISEALDDVVARRSRFGALSTERHFPK